MSWMDEDFTKSDSREYFLKECVNSKKVIPAGSILQVTQCVNVSVPRKNKESDGGLQDSKNSIIKVTLTDGKSSVQGLVTEGHPHLTSSTVPGSKVEITNDIPLVMGLVVLNNKNIRVLGGYVPALVEHWKMQIAQDKLRSWGFRGNTTGNDGPPLWKPFNVRGGGKVDRVDLRNVKAMDLVKEQIEVKSDDPSKSQFEAQRLEAISELAKKTQLKSFGEGKRLVDKGILDIVNEGFSEEQAEEAIRRFKNPRKALKYLKNSKENSTSGPREDVVDKDFTRGPRKGGRRKGRDKDEDDDDGPTGNELGEQPSNSINLFGFIQQKIKTEDDPGIKNLPQSESRQDSFGNTSQGPKGRRDDRNFRKDGDSQYQDSRNGYRRNDNNKYPGKYNDISSAPPRTQESRDSLYGSGQPRRGSTTREVYQRNDRGGRDNSDYYSRQQQPSDSYQNDSRNNYRYGNHGGSNQGNHRQSAPPPRNFVSNQRAPEVTMEFSNSSQFPSLEDEFASRPRSMHSENRPPRREAEIPRQDSYHGGDSNSYNYNRYGKESQYRQPQGHQTYPTRNRDYDGFDRNSRPYPDGRNSRGGRDHDQQHYDVRFNQVEQKFQNMAVRSDYGSEGDWRPSQTMVFTRSRNSGAGGNSQGRNREYTYKDRPQ